MHILLVLHCSPCNTVLNFIYEANEAPSNYSFNKCVLCFNYMPGRVLGTKDSAVNQISWHVLKDGYIESVIERPQIVRLGSYHTMRLWCRYLFLNSVLSMNAPYVRDYIMMPYRHVLFGQFNAF